LSANAQRSDFSGLERVCALAERVGVKQQLPAAHQQVLAFRGEPDASSGSREQPQPQFILQ